MIGRYQLFELQNGNWYFVQDFDDEEDAKNYAENVIDGRYSIKDTLNTKKAPEGAS